MNCIKTNNPDKLSVLELRDGSVVAFEEIFKCYFEQLFLYAKHYVVDEDVARNIVQDAYIVLWEKKNEIREDVKLKFFLLSIIRNKCLNYLKREKLQNNYRKSIISNYRDLMFNYDALQKMNLSQFDYNEIESIVSDTIEQLPLQCRTVFSESRVNGLTNKEIAEKLGISIKTVEAHISRALKSLRVSLKDYLNEWALAFLLFGECFKHFN
ncbi:MAG: RNA polymerase sigma-70 factor [Bacteroidota bacterium]|nr:RNA polymerase sigma-70 factor [Bacteroidota bacterium]MDP4204910.1 RNA polymerase sigma-70 factor [Bacteroidota bacterium]